MVKNPVAVNKIELLRFEWSSKNRCLHKVDTWICSKVSGSTEHRGAQVYTPRYSTQSGSGRVSQYSETAANFAESFARKISVVESALAAESLQAINRRGCPQCRPIFICLPLSREG